MYYYYEPKSDHYQSYLFDQNYNYQYNIKEEILLDYFKHIPVKETLIKGIGIKVKINTHPFEDRPDYFKKIIKGISTDLGVILKAYDTYIFVSQRDYIFITILDGNNKEIIDALLSYFNQIKKGIKKNKQYDNRTRILCSFRESTPYIKPLDFFNTTMDLIDQINSRETRMIARY